MPRIENIAIIAADPGERDELLALVTGRGFLGEAFASAGALVRARRPAGLVLVVWHAEGDEVAATVEALREHAVLGRTGVVALVHSKRSDSHTSAFRCGVDDVADLDGHPEDLWARLEARLSAPRRGTLDHASKTQVVVELSRVLGTSRPVRESLLHVAERLAATLEVDRASVILAHDGEATAYVITSSDDPSLRDLPIRLADYPEVRATLERGHPVVVPDAATHAMFEAIRPDVVRRFRSLWLTPIIYEDHPIGVVFLRSRQPRTPTDEDVFVAEAVAAALGIALRNARLLQTLRVEARRTEHARIAAEQRLRSLEPYAEFFMASADGIVVIDLRGRVLFCNPAACVCLGRERNELEGAQFEELLGRDARKRFERFSESFTDGVFPSHVDLAIKTASGERRVLSVSFSSALREDGIVVSLRDVSDERAIERELTKTKEFLQRVIDSSVDAIVSADREGTILLFNPAAERIYGYRASEVVGAMNVEQLYPEGVARELMKLIRSPDFGGEGQLRDHRTQLVGKGGVAVPALLSAALILHRGRAIGSVGVLKDLRDRLAIEARLLATEQELATQAKKAVVAEIAGATAHELNQPLTTVMGYADLLSRRLADSELAGASDAIVREATRMAEIVRKIGKLTRYETKPYVGDAQIIDIDRSIESEPSRGG